MQYEQPLNILILAAEIVPFAKVGGLADVVGALPKALKALGHDVRLIMPRYRQVDPERFQLKTIFNAVPVQMGRFNVQVSVREGTIGDSIPVYMIDAPRYFDRENIYGYTDDGERFILFCRAALEAVRALNWSPDIVHCNDWHTGIVPNWLHTVYHTDPLFTHTATVYTIHNLAYQGIFGYRIDYRHQHGHWSRDGNYPGASRACRLRHHAQSGRRGGRNPRHRGGGETAHHGASHGR